MGIIPRISSFDFGGPSSSAWSGGAISDMGCMVPQLFAAGGNWSYPEFGAIIGDRRYPRYKTLIVAPEPSVERVAGAGHSMVGRTSSHMLLQALPRDSMARLWG
jgi:hypothetical protein